jgi:sugar diacid utilization regulator
MTQPDWLDDACSETLSQPDTHRDQRARELGARAADTSIDLADLSMALVRAAQRLNPANDASVLLHNLLTTTTACVAAYRDHTRAALTRNDAERNALINDLLTGHSDPGELSHRAHRYGIRLSGAHTVLVARAPALTTEAAHTIDARLAERFGAGNTLTTLRDGHLVCISTGGLRGIAAELAHHLMTILGAGHWQIAVGRSHPGVPGLATSMVEARNALDLAERLDFTAPVVHAADLLVFPVLLRDRDAITDLVTTVLGPLRHARGGAQPYLDTLRILFENQGNYTAAARHLHLSVRAVTYRLDRIKTLTGYHPNEPTQQFTLHTAVLGARLLGWHPSTHTAIDHSPLAGFLLWGSGAAVGGPSAGGDPAEHPEGRGRVAEVDDGRGGRIDSDGLQLYCLHAGYRVRQLPQRTGDGDDLTGQTNQAHDRDPPNLPPYQDRHPRQRGRDNQVPDGLSAPMMDRRCEKAADGQPGPGRYHTGDRSASRTVEHWRSHVSSVTTGGDWPLLRDRHSPGLVRSSERC